MAMFSHKYLIAFMFLLFTNIAYAQTNIEQVDMKLVIVLDTSLSIDDDKLKWIIREHYNAFDNSELKNILSNGKFGKIAVTIIQFADKVVIVQDWIVINNLDNLKMIFTDMKRETLGSTGLGIGLLKTIEQLEKTEINSIYNHMIIFGDGIDNLHVHPYPLAERISKNFKITISTGIILTKFITFGEVEKYFYKYVNNGMGNFSKVIVNDGDITKLYLDIFKRMELR